MNIFKSMKKILLCLIATLLFPQFSHATNNNEELITAWQGEFEAFLPWYAKKMGWDKELGYNLKMLRFESGKTIAEELQAINWEIAAIGTKPALMSIFSYKMSIIGIATDESKANAILTKPNNPILTSSNKDLAQYVKGKEFICTPNSSAEYLLDSWLHNIGLSKKDIKFTPLAPKVASKAFISGKGDYLVSWSPYTLTAEDQGNKIVTDAANCNLSELILLVANQDIATKYPQKVDAFLKLYFKAADWILTADKDEVAKEYMQFNKEWIGLTLDHSTALRDLQHHEIYDVKKQLELFKEENQTSFIRQSIKSMVKYYNDRKEIKKEDLPRLERLDNITVTYLKNVANEN